MQKQWIETNLGPIAVFLKTGNPSKTPLILLHGLYFDHQLWIPLLDLLDDRPLILLDMPLHGQSRQQLKVNCSFHQVVPMLFEILDALGLPKVYGLGHSWGSMILLRAAVQQPERFVALGLCNMPFKASTRRERLMIRLQHLALPFKSFYIKQTAKALMSPLSLKVKPFLLEKLQQSMSQLQAQELRHLDRIVRMEAQDAQALCQNLQVPALALLGEEDYVGQPPLPQVVVLKGGHVSPLEVSDDFGPFLNRFLAFGS